MALEFGVDGCEIPFRREDLRMSRWMDGIGDLCTPGKGLTGKRGVAQEVKRMRECVERGDECGPRRGGESGERFIEECPCLVEDGPDFGSVGTDGVGIDAVGESGDTFGEIESCLRVVTDAVLDGEGDGVVDVLGSNSGLQLPIGGVVPIDGRELRAFDVVWGEQQFVGVGIAKFDEQIDLAQVTIGDGPKV